MASADIMTDRKETTSDIRHMPVMTHVRGYFLLGLCNGYIRLKVHLERRKHLNICSYLSF